MKKLPSYRCKLVPIFCRGNGLGHLSSESGLDMGLCVNFRLRFDEELYLAARLCTLSCCCLVFEEEEEEKLCKVYFLVVSYYCRLQKEKLNETRRQNWENKKLAKPVILGSCAVAF